MPTQDYDEQAELRRYLWGQFSVICTEAERSVYKANLGRQKAANSPSQDRMLRKMFGDWSEPLIAAELRDGFDSYSNRVLQRIDSECRELFYINRCEACGRIVATPKACICGWCGHEWFARREEQEQIAVGAFERVEQQRREQVVELTREGNSTIIISSHPRPRSGMTSLKRSVKMKKRSLGILLALVIGGIGIYFTANISQSERSKHRSFTSKHTCVEIRNLLTKGVSSDEFRVRIDSLPRLRPTIGTLIYDLADGTVMVTFPDDKNQDIDRWNITEGRSR